MRTLEQIKQGIKDEGVVWLGGAMEFPANLPIQQAYEKAASIASQCGYIVRIVNDSRLEICGGCIVGSMVCRWIHPDKPGPQAIYWYEDWHKEHIIDIDTQGMIGQARITMDVSDNGCI